MMNLFAAIGMLVAGVGFFLTGNFFGILIGVANFLVGLLIGLSLFTG